MTPAIQIYAGRTALAHIAQYGLRAQDIAVVPAAAGGAKGLILQALDQWVFGEWLPSAPRERSLIGSSLGAWRMAAACHAAPMDAFKRLGDAYCEQRYPRKHTPQHVTQEIQKLLQQFVGGHAEEILTHPNYRLHVLASRGRGLLRAPKFALIAKLGFAHATLSNLRARTQLAAHFDRVIIGDQRDPLYWLRARFDAFDTHFAPLVSDNLVSALLASANLPLSMAPVRQIVHAPAGCYWDGSLVDYHLALPYSRVAGDKDGGLVFYPHYADQIVPGWLDKHLRWRHAGAGAINNVNGNHGTASAHWLDNVVMVTPSAAFLKILPFGKLPSRRDFAFYGNNNQLRIQSWKLAMAASHYMRDAFATFVARPDLAQIKPLT